VFLIEWWFSFRGESVPLWEYFGCFPSTSVLLNFSAIDSLCELTLPWAGLCCVLQEIQQRCWPLPLSVNSTSPPPQGWPKYSQRGTDSPNPGRSINITDYCAGLQTCPAKIFIEAAASLLLSLPVQPTRPHQKLFGMFLNCVIFGYSHVFLCS